MTQTLRQQQDAAYLESLQADREKERKRKAEEEKKREEELEIKRMKDEETQRREVSISNKLVRPQFLERNRNAKNAHLLKQDLRRQKEETAANLKPEPSPKDPNVIRIVIKLPNGARLERRFQTTDSLLVIE